MKKTGGICLLCFCLLASNGSWSPAYAQKNFPKWLKSLTSFHKPVKLPPVKFPQLYRLLAKASLPAKAFSSHPTAHMGMLFAPITQPVSTRPLQPAPKAIQRAVFTLQAVPGAKGKGSAFAVLIDGEMWGVTARHVLDDIGRAPYLSIPDQKGKEFFFQVNSVREGNIHGADIAVFRIPPQVQPRLTPLVPDYRLPAARSSVQSAGFSHGNFGWFPRIQVFFSSTHRILTRYQDSPIRSGYCGSPLLSNGKVVGVFAGVITSETARKSAWYSALFPHLSVQINSFNYAIPITWVRKIIKQSTQPQGTVLKFKGRPIGVLHPDENIRAIEQIRNDRHVKSIPAYPFMDYKRLEHFFDIQPHDVFRIIIRQGDRSSQKRRTYWYELHMDTHQVLVRQ